MFGFFADVVVALHFAFVLFVVAGGLLVLRWSRVAWVHVPAAAWGALISFFGWVCPLTPLENHYRRRAGQAGYTGGFVDQYVMPVLYPGQLTRPLQITLGVLVLLANGAIYALVLRRRRSA